MARAGLIGDPVGHSLSAVMHNAAFADLGIEATYDLWQTKLADLPARIASLRELDILGANVTVPHKQAVIPFLDDISSAATRIGAVNTIVPTDGKLVGENTDIWGFARALDLASGSTQLQTAIVVGAGGAARAVLVHLQEASFERIVLVNRTRARAESLARALAVQDRPTIEVRPWEDLTSVAASADLLVNATSVGWNDDLPFDDTVLEQLTGAAYVMDLTYRETALLRLARYRGLHGIDGLPMLIYQGVRAFELWTGRTAPVEVMTRAVMTEQARRQAGNTRR